MVAVVAVVTVTKIAHYMLQEKIAKLMMLKNH